MLDRPSSTAFASARVASRVSWLWCTRGKRATELWVARAMLSPVLDVAVRRRDHCRHFGTSRFDATGYR